MENYNNILYRLIIGIKRNPIKLLVSIFVAYTILWTIIEPIIGMIKKVELFIIGWQKFLIFVLISIIIGLLRVISQKEIIIKHSNTIIRIAFGDLFSYEGIKVIPVSRYFFETTVQKTSLQYMIIDKFIKNYKNPQEGLEKYYGQLLNALKNVGYEDIYRQETKQKDKFYPIGTTALVELNNEQYLLFSTEKELAGYIPSDNCNITFMWIALEKFWSEAYKYALGESINIPLIGSGITGINLSPILILELNLLAIINALTQQGKIRSGEIRIILHQKYFEEIDLNSIKEAWTEKK